MNDLLIFWCFLLMESLMQGQIIRVPGDHAQIHEEINAAVPGINIKNIVQGNEPITESVKRGSTGLDSQLPLEGNIIPGNIFTGNNCNSRSGALTIETTEHQVLQSLIFLEGNYFLLNQAKNNGAFAIVFYAAFNHDAALKVPEFFQVIFRISKSKNKRSFYT